MSASGYVDIDAAPAPEIYIQRLDTAGASPFHRELAARSLERLQLRPGARVLEVGCGTGAHVLAMASRIGPGGEAVGVDRSRVMIETCEQRSASRPLLPARFVRADATRLPFDSDTFDSCRAMRTLLHIDDAALAMAEMARVTRPGGTVVTIEPDYGAARIEGADPDITQRMIAARVAHFAQGRAGLWTAAWAMKAGLRVLAHEEAWSARRWGRAQEERYRRRYAQPAIALGTVSAEDAERWIDDLRRAASQERYRHDVCVRVTTALCS